MKRLFLLTTLLLGLFLSLSAGLLSIKRNPDAAPLEWLYYLTQPENALRQHLYRSQTGIPLHQNLSSDVSRRVRLDFASHSPDGNWLIFDGNSAMQDIYAFSLQTLKWHNLNTSPTESEFFVTWQGDWLIYRRMLGNAYGELWRTHLSTHANQRISPPDINHNAHPLVSPDQRYLLWLNYADNLNPTAIMRFDAATQSLDSFPLEMFNAHLVYLSPDNTTAYLQGHLAEEYSNRLYRLSLADAQLSPISPLSLNNVTFAGASPDASRLYYYEYTGDYYVLSMAWGDASRAPEYLLDMPSRPMFNPSPSGEYFLLPADIMYRIRSADGQLETLGMFYHPQWTADNRILGFQSGDIYLFDYPAPPRQLTPATGVISWHGLDHWLIHGDYMGNYYRTPFDSGTSTPISIIQEAYEFIATDTLPTHPIPHKSLAAGLALIFIGLFFMYQSRAGGLSKSA